MCSLIEFLEIVRRVSPKLHLIDDILIMSTFEDPKGAISMWLPEFGGNPVELEKFINHVHISDIWSEQFADRDELTFARLEELCDLYCAMLDFEIKKAAPGRAYEITVHKGQAEAPVVELPNGRKFRAVEMLDIQVTCYLKR